MYTEQGTTKIFSYYRNEILQYYDLGLSVFDQPVKNDLKTYDNIRKISFGLRDGYTTGCLLDYPYLKEH